MRGTRAVALLALAAACGNARQRAAPEIVPARIATVPSASASAAPAPRAASCVPPPASPLTLAVDDLLSEGQLEAAVTRTLEAQRADPRDPAPARLRRAESKLSEQLREETLVDLQATGMLILAHAGPLAPNTPAPPPPPRAAELMRAAFGADAPKVRTAPFADANNDVFAEHDVHDLRDETLIHPGIPREIGGARLARTFVHGDHTIATYFTGVDTSTVLIAREGAKPRAYAFGPDRVLDIADARLVDRVLVLTLRFNAYAPSATMLSSFIAAYDVDSGDVIHTTALWPRLTHAEVDYSGSGGRNGGPKPPALDEADALMSHTGDDDRCWAKHAILALSARDVASLRAALGHVSGGARAIVALANELRAGEKELASHSKELDLARARFVAVTSSPDRAVVVHPTGALPPKARTLRQTTRVKIDDPTKTPPTAYDARFPFEMGQRTELPPGARDDIPLTFGGRKLGVISESNGKLLLLYGERYLAVASGTRVDFVLDTNPEGLLKGDDQWFQDLHDAKVEGDVVYVCRGYNSHEKRKGTVSAVDTRTGDVMWRSESFVCGGVLALVGDYVITGYGAVDRPYALKLLRKADGRTMQTIPHYGAALDLVVDGDEVTMRTFVDQVTYRLSP